jgi:arylsulfatase A-like enzyme
MGVGDTSAYQDFSRIKNSGQVLTPVMQRFADSGVRFTDAHSPGPACAPTRRGIMMGDFERSAFGSAATLPEMLRRGEYRIYGVGKWHLPVFEHHLESPGNEPIARGPFSIGFHHYAGTQGNIRKSKSYFVDRTVMIYDEETKKLVPNDSADEPGYDKPGGPREEISQQLWLDYARKWMAEHLESEPHANSPFFLYYPSHANHMNYRPPKHLDGIRVEGACRTADGQPLPEDRDGLIKARSEMIAENDAALGILLDWLENHDDPRNPGHKLIDNTFFIFTSDNGANVDPGAPAHGPLGARKTQQKEGGHRVPLIARWGDRFPARSTSAETISQVDFYATFAAAAGVDLKPEEALDSFNIIDATLRPGSKRKVRQAGILTTGLRTARLENFKAIADPDGNFIEIYDLGKDLGETNNLIGLPEYAKQEKALREFVEKSRRDGRTRPK